MSQFTWDFAICKWIDRETATYQEMATSSTVVDRYGRYEGEADFGIPRTPIAETENKITGYTYRYFVSDATSNTIVYRRVGYFQGINSQQDFDDFIDEHHNIYSNTHQDIRNLITTAGSGALKREIVSTLPATGEEGKIYFVPNGSGTSLNYYDEYMYVNGSWEKIGGGTTESSTTISTYADIQRVVRNGEAEKYFKIGDFIHATHSVFGEIKFQIVAFDKATPEDSTKTHSITMMAYNLLPNTYQFDAAEPNNPDSYRKSYGNNRWLYSNIRQWLNSSGSANSWYTAQHDYDSAPSYANQAGFKAGFSSDFLAILGVVVNTSAKPTVDGGGFETSNDLFYLPSRTEIFNQNNNNVAEGTNWTELFGPTVLDVDRIKYITGSSTSSNWWLRSCNPSISCNAYNAYSTGVLYHASALNNFGVSPVVNVI